jgi:hypothetical protein
MRRSLCELSSATDRPGPCMVPRTRSERGRCLTVRGFEPLAAHPSAKCESCWLAPTERHQSGRANYVCVYVRPLPDARRLTPSLASTPLAPGDAGQIRLGRGCGAEPLRSNRSAPGCTSLLASVNGARLERSGSPAAGRRRIAAERSCLHHDSRSRGEAFGSGAERATSAAE